jgi:TIR domain-containing protein
MVQPEELIFVSYARKDIDRVRPVYEELKQAGFVLWLDQEQLVAGQYWEDEIVRVIRAARIFLLFLSSSWVDSRGFIQKELRLALDVLQELPSDQVFIVPVRLDDCKVPPELSELNWMDLRGESDAGKLCRALSKILAGEPAEFFVQSPILLGSDPIRKGSETVMEHFYNLVLMSLASDKINQTIADGEQHSAMSTTFLSSGLMTMVMIHVHPGAPAQVAQGLRGIFTERLNMAAPFLKHVTGLLMLDYFVEKLRPADLQSVRLSLAVTFLPFKGELPAEISFAILHQEMLTEDEWQQMSELYQQGG